MDDGMMVVKGSRILPTFAAPQATQFKNCPFRGADPFSPRAMPTKCDPAGRSQPLARLRTNSGWFSAGAGEGKCRRKKAECRIRSEATGAARGADAWSPYRFLGNAVKRRTSRQSVRFMNVGRLRW